MPRKSVGWGIEPAVESPAVADLRVCAGKRINVWCHAERQTVEGIVDQESRYAGIADLFCVLPDVIRHAAC